MILTDFQPLDNKQQQQEEEEEKRSYPHRSEYSEEQSGGFALLVKTKTDLEKRYNSAKSGIVSFVISRRTLLIFATVGGSGVLVNEGLLWLLTVKFGLFYLLSSVIAIETSIFSNFILNDRFTFGFNLEGTWPLRLGKYNLLSFVTVAINITLLFLLTLIGVYYLAANLIGISVAFIGNYFGSSRWAWRKRIVGRRPMAEKKMTFVTKELRPEGKGKKQQNLPMVIEKKQQS
jgi:putative flippase GtrA